MKNKVVLFYGAPSSGKLTMAKMLAERNGFRLVDNHLFHDIVQPFIKKDGSEFQEYVDLIIPLRKAFYDIVTRFYPKDEPANYVFTVWLADLKEDIEEYNKIKDFAAKINAEFYPIELNAAEEVLLSRVEAPERAARRKIHSKEKLSEILKQYKLFSSDHKNKLAIDVGMQSIEERYELVKNHLEL
ncbi:MAG: hypothetical protein LBK26_01555 [Rickettsiales bacterium]|jgi:adenylate kinase family enzyme|nr:hypothetical protein [Rickettsiales bacterium]